MSQTKVLEKVETETGYEEPEVAHIGMKEDITRAYIEGIPIRALCGEVFIPSRDPEKLPVCQPCLVVKERLVSGMRGLN